MLRTFFHHGRATPWILGAIGVLSLSLGFGVRYLGSTEPAAPLEVNGIHLDQPKPVVDFSLMAHNNQPFTAASLKGKWTFIYFGYTFCPDVCPMTFAQLTKAQEQLAERGADQDNAYLLVSVDPKRDTPERLQEYVTSFNPNFAGATGEREQLTVQDTIAKFAS